MRNLTLFLLFCLLGTSLTSCIEDISFSTPVDETSGVSEPNPIGDQHNFRLGSTDVKVDFAYLQTTPLQGGETFSHHLVLTGRDVLQDGDLLSGVSTPVVAVSFTSNSASPVGTFPLVREGDSEPGVQALGGRSSFNFATNGPTIAGNSYTAGELVVTAEGDDFAVTFDFSMPGNFDFFKLEGNYLGAIKTIETPAVEVGDEEFSGESFMRRNQEEFPVTNAYLVKYDSHYRLFLSDRPVHEAEELTLSGTSNVMLFMMPGENSAMIRSGRYQLGNAFTTRAGYFEQLRGAQFKQSYFCRDMDFDLDRAADDEHMDEGETLVQVNGDVFKIKFNFMSSRNGHVEGEYHGQILEASK